MFRNNHVLSHQNLACLNFGIFAYLLSDKFAKSQERLPKVRRKTCHETDGSGANVQYTGLNRVVAINRLSWVVCFGAFLHAHHSVDSKRRHVTTYMPF